jgi:hypothetical protein
VFVFFDEKVIFHLEAYLVIAERARWRGARPSSPGVSGNMAMSSANSDIHIRLTSSSDSMSWIYMRKRKGARIEPCGTPAVSVYSVDILPSIPTTCIVLFSNRERIIK